MSQSRFFGKKTWWSVFFVKVESNGEKERESHAPRKKWWDKEKLSGCSKIPTWWTCAFALGNLRFFEETSTKKLEFSLDLIFRFLWKDGDKVNYRYALF